MLRPLESAPANAGSLFPDASAGKTPRARLIEAYARELLAKPPVKSLRPGEFDTEIDERLRQAEALRLATKDVARLIAAAEAADLLIVDNGAGIPQDIRCWEAAARERAKERRG